MKFKNFIKVLFFKYTNQWFFFFIYILFIEKHLFFCNTRPTSKKKNMIILNIRLKKKNTHSNLQQPIPIRYQPCYLKPLHPNLLKDISFSTLCWKVNYFNLTAYVHSSFVRECGKIHFCAIYFIERNNVPVIVLFFKEYIHQFFFKE